MEFPDERLEHRRGNEGCVAGEKEDGGSSGGFESGINTAQRTAPRDQIFAEDANGQCQRAGIGSDMTQQRAAAKPQVSFVAYHARTQVASDNANFQVGLIGYNAERT